MLEFTVRITALSTRQLYSVFINWLAFDDSRVTVGYIFSEQLGALAQGSGERTISLKLGFKWPTAVKPESVVGNAFLLGVRFPAPNANMRIKTNVI